MGFRLYCGGGEMIKFLKQLFCKHSYKPIENITTISDRSFEI